MARTSGLASSYSMLCINTAFLPIAHDALEERQRNATGTQNHAMVSLDGKLRAHRSPGFLTQLEDLHLPDFVGAGLTRPHHVAIDFALWNAIVNRLLPGPAFRVQSGIHHEPAGAEDFTIETPKIAGGVVFVPTQIRCQALCVKTPAFRKGGHRAERTLAAEARKRGHLDFQGYLEVVPRNPLVCSQGAHQ